MSEPITPAEREAKGEGATASLCGEPIHVPPMNQWRSSAVHAFQNADYETWAQKTLSESDYEIWADIDPTLDDINAFLEEAGKALGLGKSRASRRS